MYINSSSVSARNVFSQPEVLTSLSLWILDAIVMTVYFIKCPLYRKSIGTLSILSALFGLLGRIFEHYDRYSTVYQPFYASFYAFQCLCTTFVFVPLLLTATRFDKSVYVGMGIHFGATGHPLFLTALPLMPWGFVFLSLLLSVAYYPKLPKGRARISLAAFNMLNLISITVFTIMGYAPGKIHYLAYVIVSIILVDLPTVAAVLVVFFNVHHWEHCEQSLIDERSVEIPLSQ